MSVSDIEYNHGLIHKMPSFHRACCVLLPKKIDAQKALDLMFSILNKYGVVTVYDLYLAIGAETCTEDDLIGWESLEGAFIKPTFNRREYRLVLPKLNYDGREYNNYE